MTKFRRQRLLEQQQCFDEWATVTVAFLSGVLSGLIAFILWAIRKNVWK